MRCRARRGRRNLKQGAVMRDLLLAVRADEACHSHVNHTLRCVGSPPRPGFIIVNPIPGIETSAVLLRARSCMLLHCCGDDKKKKGAGRRRSAAAAAATHAVHVGAGQ